MCKGLAQQVNQLQVTLHKMEIAMGVIADAVIFAGEDGVFCMSPRKGGIVKTRFSPET